MLREHSVRLTDVTLNVAEGPRSGPPLVLLHGGSNRWQAWTSILPALAERWHVLAPDLRGHGGSSWARGGYSIRSITDDIVELLERVVQAPVALLGHSLGAQVGLWAAARRPDAVRAVVAGDALPGRGAEASVGRQREQFEFQRRYAGSDVDAAELAGVMRDLPFGRDASGVIVRAFDVLGEHHPEYLDWAETMKALDPAFVGAVMDYAGFSAGFDVALLPQVSCPVMILRAGDGDLPVEDVNVALRLLPDGRAITLPGVGHGLHRQAPEAVLAAILPFLEAVDEA